MRRNNFRVSYQCAHRERSIFHERTRGEDQPVVEGRDPRRAQPVPAQTHVRTAGRVKRVAQREAGVEQEAAPVVTEERVAHVFIRVFRAVFVPESMVEFAVDEPEERVRLLVGVVFARRRV